MIYDIFENACPIFQSDWVPYWVIKIRIHSRATAVHRCTHHTDSVVESFANLAPSKMRIMISRLHIFQIVLLAFAVGRVENAKILCVVGFPGPSHFMMFRVLLEELANRGHEVDVVTALPKQNSTRLNFIKIPDLLEGEDMEFTVQQARHQSVHAMMDMMLGSQVKSSNICGKLFDSREMRELRDSEKMYDLLIFEMFIFDCVFGFAHVHKGAPIVAVTSSVNLPWGAHRIGNPDNPSYIPTYFRDLTPGMTLFERILNTFTLLHAKLLHHKYFRLQDEEARKFFGRDMPYLEEIVSNTSLFIVNSHFSLNQARPAVPNFIEAGGLHIRETKPLDKDLVNFLGDSKFIYFSLGTVTSSETIPLEKLQHFCDVFKSLGHKVLWKVDRENIPKELEIPDNVYTRKWLPQLDILCHPNILFFITHNGLMGTQEAVHCGVPMLSIPMFADQYLNARNMVEKGVAIEVNLEEFTRDELQSYMKELVEKPKYKQNAVSLSKMFKDRPRKPLEEAVFWIEYVLRHRGAPQLRSKAADLAWYQYYLVDVVLVVLTVTLAVLYIFYCLLKYFFSGFSLSIKYEPKHKSH